MQKSGQKLNIKTTMYNTILKSTVMFNSPYSNGHTDFIYCSVLRMVCFVSISKDSFCKHNYSCSFKAGYFGMLYKTPETRLKIPQSPRIFTPLRR